MRLTWRKQVREVLLWVMLGVVMLWIWGEKGAERGELVGKGREKEAVDMLVVMNEEPDGC